MISAIMLILMFFFFLKNGRDFSSVKLKFIKLIACEDTVYLRVRMIYIGIEMLFEAVVCATKFIRAKFVLGL